MGLVCAASIFLHPIGQQGRSRQLDAELASIPSRVCLTLPFAHNDSAARQSRLWPVSSYSVPLTTMPSSLFHPDATPR